MNGSRGSLVAALVLIALAFCMSACSADLHDYVKDKSLWGTPAPGAPGGSHPTNPPGGGAAGSVGSGGSAGSGASSYVALARADAIAEGIDADAFVRQVNQESGFRADVYGRDGEVGMCQFLPSTAKGLGVNPYSPESCLRGMAGVMGRYSREFGGDYAAALAGYNCGGGCIRSAMRYASWGCHVPASTQSYVKSIMGIVVC